MSADTTTAQKLNTIARAREAFDLSDTTDEALLAQDAELRPQLTPAQLTELDDEEVVTHISENGWCSTVGGVEMDPQGGRHFPW